MSQPQEASNIVSAESRFPAPAPANEPASAGQRFLARFLDVIVAGVPAFIPIAGWIWAILYAWRESIPGLLQPLAWLALAGAVSLTGVALWFTWVILKKDQKSSLKPLLGRI